MAKAKAKRKRKAAAEEETPVLELYRLICDRDWSGVVGWCDKWPLSAEDDGQALDNAVANEAAPARVTKTQLKWSMWPEDGHALNKAVLNEAPAKVIEALLKVRPESIDSVRKEVTPLHWIAQHYPPQLGAQAVRVFRKRFPPSSAGALARDLGHGLPDHLAARIAAYLAHPAAARDFRRLTPLGLYCQIRYGRLQLGGYISATQTLTRSVTPPRLSVAERNRREDADNQFVLALASAYPRALGIQSYDGWSPLHYLFMRPGNVKLRLAEKLLDMTHPDDLLLLDRSQRTPLHWACESLRSCDDQSPDDSSEFYDAVLTLLWAQPDAAKMGNSAGGRNTPLVCALMNLSGTFAPNGPPPRARGLLEELAEAAPHALTAEIDLGPHQVFPELEDGSFWSDTEGIERNVLAYIRGARVCSELLDLRESFTRIAKKHGLVPSLRGRHTGDVTSNI